MRQIDADKLKNDIMNIRYNCVGMRAGKVLLSDFAAQYREDILATIDEQPTAYDIDKVVEQLEDEISRYDKKYHKIVMQYHNIAANATLQGNIHGFQKAIEIVKGGGKHDD